MLGLFSSITQFVHMRSQAMASRTLDSIDRRLSSHMLWTKFRFRSQRGRFYRDLARSAKFIDGTSLTAVVEKYARRYPKLPVGVIARHWLRRWEHSGQFSQVIRGTVPDEDIVVIQASESLGDLNSGILMLGQNIMQLQKTKDTLVYSLGTSVLLFGFFHLFMGLQAFLVQARLEKAVIRYLKPEEVPAIAHVFFDTASVIRSYWPLWIVFLVGMISLIVWSLPRYTGRMRPV
jgi:type II secretory pathway component PulF